MPVVNSYVAGTFCQPGLCSGNAAEAKRFYSSLFGWEAVDMTMPGGAYTMFKLDGETVAGMYQMKEERKAAGVHPHWNSYLTVENVDAVAAQVPHLGGRVLSGPFDADGDRMANLEDPTGARFSIWQRGEEKEPEAMRLNEVGALCWSELCTPDTEVAGAFYSQLLGWLAKPFDGGPIPYTVFHRSEADECGLGGMIAITEEMGCMPTQWLPYFQVEDADATAARARDLGATVHGPIDVPTVGRILMIQDAEGAGFATLQIVR